MKHKPGSRWDKYVEFSANHHGRNRMETTSRIQRATQQVEVFKVQQRAKHNTLWTTWIFHTTSIGHAKITKLLPYCTITKIERQLWGHWSCVWSPPEGWHDPSTKFFSQIGNGWIHFIEVFQINLKFMCGIIIELPSSNSTWEINVISLSTARESTLLKIPQAMAAKTRLEYLKQHSDPCTEAHNPPTPPTHIHKVDSLAVDIIKISH